MTVSINLFISFDYLKDAILSVMRATTLPIKYFSQYLAKYLGAHNFILDDKIRSFDQIWQKVHYCFFTPINVISERWPFVKVFKLFSMSCSSKISEYLLVCDLL